MVPGRKRIAFWDDGIRVIHPGGGNDWLVVPTTFHPEGGILFRPAWSTDGQRIAFVRHDGAWMWPLEIYIAPLDGTRPTLVKPFVETEWYFSHWSPAWSPDGRSLAFIHNFVLMTAPVGSTDFKTLNVRAAYESDLDWSPDGRQLLFSDYNGDRALTRPPFNGRLRIYALSIVSGEVRQLIPEAVAPANPDYQDNNAVWSRARP